MRALFIVGILLLMGVSGCASYEHGRIDVRTVETYSSNVKASGVAVAADPYATTEKAKEGFYVDVTSKGFYPVNLIFSNDSNDRVLVLKDEIELVDAKNNTYRPVRSTIMADEFEHNKMAYALLGFGIFSYMSAEEANRKMASDWREKELQDQLIVPSGRKMNGFVYFKLPQGDQIKGSKLKITVEKMESKEKIPIEMML